MPQKPNAYWFYMRAMKRETPGWRNKCFKELSDLCSDGWNAMTPQEKQYYEDMKTDYDGPLLPNNNKKKNKTKKGEVDIDKGMDSLGRPLRFLMNEAEEKRRRMDEERRETSRMVEVGGNCMKKEFLIVYITNYCVTKREPYVYCPAEISIGGFSVKRGFTSVKLHAFLQLAAPHGYMLACKQSCEQQLKIPVRMEEARPLQEVGEQLQQLSEEYAEPVLFCHPDVKELCINNLRTICGGAEVPFRIYSLADLTLALATAGLDPNHGIRAQTMAQMIDPARRDYEFGFGCEWHELNSDNGLCSTAMLHKWTMSVVETVCEVQQLPVPHRGNTAAPAPPPVSEEDFWGKPAPAQPEEGLKEQLVRLKI